MAAKTILIALPCGPREKIPLPPRVPAISRTIDRIKVEVDDEADFGCFKGKKRKMENLTTEEKILRKKMKNRVAAQNSRDKKKARMDDLEKELSLAREQIRQLQVENAALRLGGCTKCSQKMSSHGPQDFVPAVSKTDNPLQKGRGPRLEIHWPVWCTAWALVLLLMACRQRLMDQAEAKEELTSSKILDKRVVKDMRAERMKWWGSHQRMWNPVKIQS